MHELHYIENRLLWDLSVREIEMVVTWQLVQSGNFCCCVVPCRVASGRVCVMSCRFGFCIKMSKYYS